MFDASGFHGVVSQRKASGRISQVDRLDANRFSFGFHTVILDHIGDIYS